MLYGTLNNISKGVEVTPHTSVFYINLDDDNDRRRNIENTLVKFKFKNFKRICAFDTRTIGNLNKYKNLIDSYAYDTLINNIKIGKRSTNRELTKGAIGCYLSHIVIYNYMIQNNIPYVLIFEDDCNISESYNDFWKKISSIKIPPDTDIFLFNANIHEYNLKNCPSNNVCQVFFFYGTHFYLITLSGAHKVLKYLLPIKYQIDNSMSMLSYGQKIKIYGCYKIKFNGENNFSTTIQLLNCPTCDVLKEINYVKKKIKSINQNTDSFNYNVEGFKLMQANYIPPNIFVNLLISVCILFIILLLVIILS